MMATDVDFLSQGFLGNRADFLSDLLIVALAAIVPALLVALWAARARRPRLHRTLMWTVLGVVVAYVVVYEASMLAQGGVSFLRERIRMQEAPYFVFVAGHVAIAVSALVFAGIAVRRGLRVFGRVDRRAEAPHELARHHRIGYLAFAMLVAAVITGIGVYYLTFVHVAAGYPS